MTNNRNEGSTPKPNFPAKDQTRDQSGKPSEKPTDKTAQDKNLADQKLKNDNYAEKSADKAGNSVERQKNASSGR